MQTRTQIFGREWLNLFRKGNSLSNVTRHLTQAFLTAWLCGVGVTSILAQEVVILPDATFDKEYKNTDSTPVKVMQVKGGKEPFTWAAVNAAALPPGITVQAATGALTGTPTAAAVRALPYDFIIKVCDSNTPPQCLTHGFKLKVTGTLEITALVSPTPAPAPKPTPPPIQWHEMAGPGASKPDGNSNSDALTITVANQFRSIDNLANSSDNKAKPTFNDAINFEKGLLIGIEIPGREKLSVDNAATLLINGLLKKREELKEKDYCILHIVKWKENGSGKFESSDHWYHFQSRKKGQDDLEWLEQPPPPEGGNPRIYGSQRVAALLIHLNARKTWDIKYDVKSTGKLPTPVENLLQLAETLTKSPGAIEAAADEVHLWGGQLLVNITNLPADVAFAGKANLTDEKGKATQEAKPWNKTFDNEKRYHWDVSIGIPFTKLRQLDYEFRNSDGKPTGIVSRQESSRQDAYAFLNLYPVAVDLKSAEWWRTPHFIVGLPFRKKTFDSPMVGVGIGSYQSWLKVNFFAGAVFNKVVDTKKLQQGDTTTQDGFIADRNERRVTKLIFGLNFPLSQLKFALKK